MGNKEFWREHGDTQLPAEPRSVGASDMRQASAARTAMAGAPLGSPPTDYDVRSVYDSRPVSAFDFNIVVSMAVSGGCVTATPAFFTVPQGYVAVLREVETWVDPPVAMSLRADVTVSLQINGSDVPYNVAIPVGNGTLENIKCFAIADEYQQMGVLFPTFPTPGAYTLYAQLYGNFILKTGRPAQFEIANYAGKGYMPGMPRAAEPSAPPGVLTGSAAALTTSPTSRVYTPETSPRKRRGLLRAGRK